jgi:hypothetical protein
VTHNFKQNIFISKHYTIWTHRGSQGIYHMKWEIIETSFFGRREKDWTSWEWRASEWSEICPFV